MAQAPEILVFGGTAEGRMLVEWLDARNSCKIVACTATEYGASLLFGGNNVEVLQGPLSQQAKEQLMADHNFCCMVDATHPFATHITESIAELAQNYDVDLVRIERENIDEGSGMAVASAAEAAAQLAHTTGNILLTTGSKDLAVFTEAIPAFEERLWVRVLPVIDSITHAQGLGIPTSHILALQGPFSTQLNSALIREYRIEHLVTKQSGTTGGFAEKLAATNECGIQAWVIVRPEQNGGLYLEDAQAELEARYGL